MRILGARRQGGCPRVAPISAAAVHSATFMRTSRRVLTRLRWRTIHSRPQGFAAMRAGSAVDSQESCGLPSSFLNGAMKPMDTGATPLVYEFGEFQLDAVRRVLRSRTDARPIDLPPRAFDTLLYLVEHQGALLEKHVPMALVGPK